MERFRAVSRRARVEFALTAAVVARIAVSLGAAACEPGAYLPGEVLVGLAGDRPHAAVAAAIEQVAGCEVGHDARLGVCRIRLREGLSVEAALQRLRAVPGVAFAEPNGVVRAAVKPNDPYFTARQWALQRIGADRAWEIWRPVTPTVIAILDTGIDHTHPDLVRKILRDEQGIVGYDAFTDQRSDALDDHWHGTHCAGIAAAQVNNGEGIAGVAGWNGRPDSSDERFIRLMPVKVLNRAAYGDDWRVGKGIVWAVDMGARVISLSLTTTIAEQTMKRAVAYALQKGCVVVAASGNDGTTDPNYPAAFDGVISVAATDSGDFLTEFSSYGDWVGLAAPGDNILSTLPTYPTASGRGLGYGAASGTSMACPHVAGAAALLLSQNPALGPEQVAALLQTRVDPYTATGGRTLARGAGRLNVYRALAAAGGGSLQVAAAPATVTLSPGVVTGGGLVQAIVTLTSPAPEGAVLRLASSLPSAASTPSHLETPMGATRLSFRVSTAPVSRTTLVRITVSGAGVTRSATLRVEPPPPVLATLTFSAPTVTGGRSIRGTVTLSGRAPAGGAVVVLAGSDAAALALPASVTVPAGSAMATFAVNTQPVAGATQVVVTAAYGESTLAAELTLVPAMLTTLLLRPSYVRSGRQTVGTVLLDSPAPPGGLMIVLGSSDPSLAVVEPLLHVPAGATSAPFAVATTPTPASRIVTLTASYGGVTHAAALRLLADATAARLQRLGDSGAR